jgi:hypothetical protein
MAACNVDVDNLNDAIDELSALISGLPLENSDLDKLKQALIAVKKEANPCGLENNNKGNNNKGNNNNNNKGNNNSVSRSRKRTRKNRNYRR